MSKELMGPGCSITVFGRAGLRYREGSQTVHIDGEMLAGAFDFVVYESSIREWEGSSRPIDEAKRREIISKIRATFERNGLKVDVQS